MMIETRRQRRRRGFRRVVVGMAVLLVCVLPAAAQQETSPQSEATPWTHQNHLNNACEFQFAVVSDRASSPRQGVFEAALAKLLLLRPEFVLCVGDLVQGYDAQMKPLTDEQLVRDRRRRSDETLKTLTMPFYRVAGNHDVNSDLSAKIWTERYGRAYYSFDYKGVLFLCLNSQDGPRYGPGIGGEQIAWLKDELAKHVDARWVYLFLHQPLWLDDEKRLELAKNKSGAVKLTGFGEVEKLLDGRDYTVFAGHHHRYGKWVRNGRKYYRLATTGGKSSLAGPEAGQFDHVVWISVTDKGPVVCNLLLEGILDEDAKRNLPEPPTRWEKTIAAFEAKDAKAPPPKNAVLFVGSSSIVLWNLEKSFPDLCAVNRGFGGSQIADSTHFAERIIFPHTPHTIVLYAGDNDVAKGKSAEQVFADYQTFVKKVRTQLPWTRILYICIKPSLKRWKLWPEMHKANTLIREFAERNGRSVYVDVATPMLGKDGLPRKELFAKDGLHLNEAGYAVWAEVLRPVLETKP